MIGKSLSVLLISLIFASPSNADSKTEACYPSVSVFGKSWTGGGAALSKKKILLAPNEKTILVSDPDAGDEKPWAILKYVHGQYCQLLTVPAAINIQTTDSETAGLKNIVSDERAGPGSAYRSITYKFDGNAYHPSQCTIEFSPGADESDQPFDDIGIKCSIKK